MLDRSDTGGEERGRGKKGGQQVGDADLRVVSGHSGIILKYLLIGCDVGFQSVTDCIHQASTEPVLCAG